MDSMELSITTMNKKQSILLGLFFLIVVLGMSFVASARSRQARAAAIHAMQEQQRLKDQNPTSPAR